MKEQLKGSKRVITIGIAALLIGWSAFWLIYNARSFGVTSDEVVYGPVGVRMLTRGDVIMNNEHPPLNKILAGLFLLPTRPNIDKALTEVTNNDQWHFGDVFLYESGNSTSYMMLVSRLATVAFTLIMLVSVWLWARKNLGEYAGIGALASLALNPLILSNGALTTNDIHLTVAVWLLFIATFNVISKPQKNINYLWYGLALGLVLIAKFSGIFFVGLSALIVLAVLIVRKISWKKLILGMFITLVMTLGLVWASYFAIEWRALTNHEVASVNIPKYRDVEIASPFKKTLLIPLLRYKEGYNVVSGHNQLGHNAYLDGRFSTEGFRDYFTRAIYYKTPTSLLLLIFVGLIVAIVKRRWDAVTLFAVGLFLIIMANLSHIHIGVRHVLPFFALAAPAVGLAVGWAITARNKIIAILLGLVILFWVVDISINGPSKLSYYSQVSGGWRNGYSHLLDSNTDWGQEFSTLLSYITSHPKRDYILGISSGENPRGYDYVKLDDLGTNAICDGLTPNQTLIVSVNITMGLFGPYPCIKDNIDKAERLGHTYLVWDPEDFIKN